MNSTSKNNSSETFVAVQNDSRRVQAIISSRLNQSALWICAIIIFVIVLSIYFTVFFICTDSRQTVAETSTSIPAWLIMILGLIGVIPITCLFLFFCYLIINRKRKLTELTVTEKEIVGSYTAFIPFAKIMLRMPIEKIDNAAAVNSVWDFFKGKKICISSTSGCIKIPYVANADEIVTFIFEAIEKVNGDNISAPRASSPLGAIDNLKKLAELRDIGVITEEEFNQKKNELLEKIQ